MILHYMFDHVRTTVHLDQKPSSLPTNNCFAYHGSGNHPPNLNYFGDDLLDALLDQYAAQPEYP